MKRILLFSMLSLFSLAIASDAISQVDVQQVTADLKPVSKKSTLSEATSNVGSFLFPLTALYNDISKKSLYPNVKTSELKTRAILIGLIMRSMNVVLSNTSTLRSVLSTLTLADLITLCFRMTAN